METCSLSYCPGKVFARGWCQKHYTRWSRTGDPESVSYERRKAGAHGWTDRYVEDENGCWIWNGSLDKRGYGQYDTYEGGKRKNWRAHRYVYTQLVRPLADEETIDHLCRVHACVNPAHLEPVPHAVNVDRGDAGAGKPRKTHCKNGHEFTPENSIVSTKNGGRICRECRRVGATERMRRMRERNRNSETIV